MNISMAKKMDRSRSEEQDGLIQPAPQLNLRDYKGPYKSSALLRAHATLLNHVDQVQNTAPWKKIQMKTSLNVNRITDLDDGFGMASTIYSHSCLPEMNEPYQDDFETQSNSTKNMKEIPCTSTRNDHGNVPKDFSDDSYFNEKDIDWKKMENITVTVHVQNPSKTEQQVEKKDFSLKELRVKQAPEKMSGQHKMRMNSDENVTDLTKKQSVCGCESNPVEKHYIEGEKSNLSVEEANSGNEKQITFQPVQQTMKCDFCSFRCTDLNGIQEHLQSVLHYSASRCDIDSTGELILREKMIAANKEARFTSSVMKCPSYNCSCIFLERYECVSHYNEKHWKIGMLRNQFALADIVQENECSIVLKPLKCQLCSLEFRSKTRLKKHLLEKHIPLKDSVSKCKKTFFCKYCEKSCSWIDVLVSHLQKHKLPWHTVFNFTVFQLDNIRKFHISPTGRITKTDGASNAALNSKKRTHDLTLSGDEPNLKVTRQVDITSHEVVFDSKRDNPHVFNDEKMLVNHEQTSTGSNSHDDMSSSLLVKAKSLDKDFSFQTESSDHQETLKDAFSCDYCEELAYSEDQIMSHLNKNCHASASCVLLDGDSNVKFIKWLSSVLLSDEIDQKLYATCTRNCPTLFRSVKQCIEHDVMCHESVSDYKPCYGIVEVREELNLKLSVNKCIVCGFSCNKTKNLLTHYNRKHTPFPLKDRCVVFFKCTQCHTYCSKLENLLHHAKTHLPTKDDLWFTVSVLYFNVERKIRGLSPMFSKNQKEHTEKIKNLRTTIQELGSNSVASSEGKSKMANKKALRNAKHRLIAKLT